MDIEEFKKTPVMGIVRGIAEDKIAPLMEAVIHSGLKTIEITMNTSGAPGLIGQALRAAGGKLTIGAGTVMTTNELHSALDAGASFIVSPVFVPHIVEACRHKSIPVFPGAFSPQEIYEAWEAGATMVKVFPAKMMGPDYIKEIKAPLNDIELLACGGVNAKNVQTYLSSGASAVAFGGSIFKKEWLLRGEFDLITQNIQEFLNAMK